MDKETKDAINKCIVKIADTGEDQYLIELHKLVGPTLYYITRQYFNNKFDIEDLIQDFWAKIYEIAQSFRFYLNGHAYLCKVIKNMALNRCLQIKRERETNVDYEACLDLAGSDEIDIENFDLKIMIKKGLSILTEKERKIVEETYFLRKTVRELGVEMKMSKSNVEKLKLSGLSKLRQFCTEHMGNVDKDGI